MSINISARHMELTEELKAAAQSTGDQFAKYFDRFNQINVVFHKDHNQVETEIIVAAVQGNTIVGKAEDYDAFKSLDQASKKVIRQLKKLKEKLKEKRGRSIKETSANPAERDRPGETPPEGQIE